MLIIIVITVGNAFSLLMIVGNTFPSFTTVRNDFPPLIRGTRERVPTSYNCREK